MRQLKDQLKDLVKITQNSNIHHIVQLLLPLGISPECISLFSASFCHLMDCLFQQGQDDVFFETNYCVPFSKGTQMEPYLANPTFEALGRSCDFPIETAGGEKGVLPKKTTRRLQLVCREHVGRNELYFFFVWYHAYYSMICLIPCILYDWSWSTEVYSKPI